jgi:hypothetical protein
MKLRILSSNVREINDTGKRAVVKNMLQQWRLLELINKKIEWVSLG